MIAGIGADIVEVPRMADLLARYGERFVRRVLAEAEWDGFRPAPTGVATSPAFPAKEAFAKALGTGLRYPVSLSRISITNDALGKPTLGLDPTLSNMCWVAVSQADTSLSAMSAASLARSWSSKAGLHETATPKHGAGHARHCWNQTDR